jgi:hypothetical protein
VRAEMFTIHLLIRRYKVWDIYLRTIKIIKVLEVPLRLESTVK